MRFPAAAPISMQAGHQPCGRVSKTLPAGGSTQTACQRGRGRQAMPLPCKQVDAGALPADSTIFHCGENEIQARPITSASVGATPTPATIFREVSRLPVCKTGVFKSAGSDDWSVTSTSHHFGSVAQSAEQPVVCGKAEGASPFGSAIFGA